MRTLLLSLLLPGVFMAEAQTSCNGIPMAYRADSITWEAAQLSFGDSMLSIPIQNTSGSNFAYPQAKLVPVTPLPAGMVLNINGNPWNVFASAFNDGETYPVHFFFDVNQPIPVNATVTFELWLTNLAPLQIDSCKYDGTFTYNFNPQATGVSELQNNTVQAYLTGRQLQLFSNAAINNGSIELLNTNGQQVMAYEHLSQLPMALDLSEISSGIYLLAVYNDKQRLKVQRLFVP